MPNQPKAKGSRFWRKLRIYFRRFRMAVWLLVLAGLGVLIYLNLVGLPDFLKRPLVARLAARGLDLDFETLRLHWSRGFIAERVRFGASFTNDPAATRFTAQELEFNFKLRALLAGEVQVDSIILRAGDLAWKLAASNAAPRELHIANIESTVRLDPQDCWVLENLHARFGGADFYVSGSLTNASALQRPPAAAPAGWSARLAQMADIVAQIKFAAPPELRLDFNGDARDLRSFDARFSVKAAGADTAWGQGKNLLLLTRIFPTASNELSRAEISLLAEEVETRWATTTNLEFKLRLVTAAERPTEVNASATLLADAIESPGATIRKAQLKAAWTQSVTNPVPHSARLEAHAARVAAPLVQMAEVDFAATLAAAKEILAPDVSLGFWNRLLPYQVQGTLGIGRLRSMVVQADQLAVTAAWQPPELSLSNLRAQLYQGAVSGHARLDVLTRELTGAGASDFEVRALLPLLPPVGQEWLKKFTWAAPPQVRATAAVVLPAWTNSAPDWPAELRPTLRLAGELALTNGTYRELHADWATTHFTYTNLTWELPDLVVGRPEGNLRVRHRADDATGEYFFQLHSTIDPGAVLPLLPPEVRPAFELCEFGQPPVLAGELWGRWFDHDQIGFRGSLALTNFAFRGQKFDAIVTGLTYTNLIIECLEPRAYRGTDFLSGEGIRVDLNTHRTHLTNLFGRFDPAVLVTAIGPQVAHVMAPYHFLTPPTARVNGYVPMGNPHDADVIFEGGGAAFESLNFHASNYLAKVIWKNNLLTITNVTGDFYGGKAAGWAHFEFPDLDHARYAFAVEVAGARLPALVADVTRQTNNLEGLLTGQLVITNAWTDNLKSWQGYGQAMLRDGLLWEWPIFGVLSRPLDAMIPGVGNSRFTEATGTFQIQDSIIWSPDLEMRAAALRLQYRGTVDFDGNLSARVIAEPLRDTPMVGSVVSTILSPVARLFAYRISGTMSDPKSEPIYIPKLLMVPFSPLQSLGELLAPPPVKPETFTPPPQTE